MNSKKVKEIKKALELGAEIGMSTQSETFILDVKVSDILTYINELESEKEMLNSRHRNLKINYNKTWEQYREYEVETQQLKDQIAELENGKEQTMKMWLEDRKGMFWDGVGEGELKGYKQLKQFAERLKEKIQNCSGCYIPDCFESPTNEFAYSEIEVNKAIDETLKEFLNKGDDRQ